MNLTMLKLVRDEIAAAPDKTFDMSEWALKDDDLILLRDINPTTNPAIEPGCGTCGCLAGWTVFTALKHNIALKSNRPDYHDEAACQLGIDERTAYALFQSGTAYGRSRISKVTREDALKKLDELIVNATISQYDI